jgi:hypothetical protein
MANLIDGIVAAFMLLVFGVFTLISLFVFTELSATGIFGSQAADFEKFFTALNSMGIFIAVGMSLAAALSGLMIRTHPAFFFIALILIFVEFMVVPHFVTVYNEVAETMPIAVQNEMAQQSQILQMLPALTAFGTVLAMIVGVVHE